MANFLKMFEKKVPEKKETDKKKVLLLVGIIAGGILLAAGIAWLVYRLVKKRAELEEDYEYDPDADFFEEEDD